MLRNRRNAAGTTAVGAARSALGDVGNKIAPAAAASNIVNIQNAKQLIANKQLITTATVAAKSNKMIAIETENLHQLNINKQQQQKQLAVVETKPPQQQVEQIVMTDDEEEMCQDESMHSSTSSSELVDVPDIDEHDLDNPLLAADYAKDIYKYLGDLEKRFRISMSFLHSKIVTPKMRAVLIDWLIQVHQKFHLLQETLYLCVYIIDAYLQLENVEKMKLQLVGVTAMFLASKYEEMYVPAIDDFVYMTDNTYTKADIRSMEISILKSLGFLLCKPLPLHFLRRYSKAAQGDPKQHTMAKFFMELALHDSELSSMDPSYLAACSLCISFKILSGPEWNHVLEYYTTYTEKSLMPGMQKLCKLLIKSTEPDYKYKAVTNKYAGTKFMRISIQPELNSPYIRFLANSH